ncbi:hypothetical protein CGRA01v4_13600 [Colletotrichum graminicola]|nr:hypothetical protein CGRA01v4_13600 [Colletotrichum graminicola]
MSEYILDFSLQGYASPRSMNTLCRYSSETPAPPRLRRSI